MAAASFPLGPSHPSTNSPSPPSPRSGVWKPTKAGAAPQTPPETLPRFSPYHQEPGSVLSLTPKGGWEVTPKLLGPIGWTRPAPPACPHGKCSGL